MWCGRKHGHAPRAEARPCPSRGSTAMSFRRKGGPGACPRALDGWSSARGGSRGAGMQRRLARAGRPSSSRLGTTSRPPAPHEGGHGQGGGAGGRSRRRGGERTVCRAEARGRPGRAPRAQAIGAGVPINESRCPLRGRWIRIGLWPRRAAPRRAKGRSEKPLSSMETPGARRCAGFLLPRSPLSRVPSARASSRCAPRRARRVVGFSSDPPRTLAARARRAPGGVLQDPGLAARCARRDARGSVHRCVREP